MKYSTISYLAHHGIEGQKWGVRRYQNPDGSLTPEGRRRYGVSGSVDELWKRAGVNKKPGDEISWGEKRKIASQIDKEHQSAMDKYSKDLAKEKGVDKEKLYDDMSKKLMKWQMETYTVEEVKNGKRFIDKVNNILYNGL